MQLLRRSFETRKAYFLQAFHREVENMAIISFAGCNWQCPYCKRGCQYINNEGNVLATHKISMKELFLKIDEAIHQNKRIRLSGGDPCIFKKESLLIAKYVQKKYNKKISVAHNGSSLSFIKELLPYLDYIAMDFKAPDINKLKVISGVKNPVMNQESIIKLCESKNILVDVRTPIFGDTSIDELVEIAKKISPYNNVFWTLRKYNKVQGCDFKEANIENVNKLAQDLKIKFPRLQIGIRNYWKGGFEIF